LREVFTVDEVNCISVDDAGVIVLTLDFEIIRNQVDWTFGYECCLGLIGRARETISATTAATAAATFSPSTVGRTASVLIVVSSSGVLASGAL